MRLELKKHNEKRIIDFIIGKENLKQIVLFNIGTDAVLYDSFGPFVGQMIKAQKFKHIVSYGDLKNKNMALNLKDNYKEIIEKHSNDLIIGIDAALTKNLDDEGKMFFIDNPIRAGLGIGNYIGNFGEYAIKYIVTKNGNSTRLGNIYNTGKKLIRFLQKFDKELDDEIKEDKLAEIDFFDDLFWEYELNEANKK